MCDQIQIQNLQINTNTDLQNKMQYFYKQPIANAYNTTSIQVDVHQEPPM